jgi:hypothetical protein
METAVRTARATPQPTTTGKHGINPRHVIPGHETIILAFAPVQPARWTFDDTEPGDSILLLADTLLADEIGATIQAALDDRTAALRQLG